MAKSNQYLRVLASELGVDVKRETHDLDAALRILDAIPGSKNVANRRTGGADNVKLVWYKPKKFGGRDYEVTASTFVGCVIKVGNHYKGLLRERQQVRESEDEV